MYNVIEYPYNEVQQRRKRAPRQPGKEDLVRIAPTLTATTEARTKRNNEVAAKPCLAAEASPGSITGISRHASILPTIRHTGSSSR